MIAKPRGTDKVARTNARGRFLLTEDECPMTDDRTETREAHVPGMVVGLEIVFVGWAPPTTEIARPSRFKTVGGAHPTEDA